MPTIRLTRRAVTALPTPSAPTVIYDSEVKGFGLAMRPTGARSWVVEYRPGGGGRGVAKRRVKLGDPDVMTVEEARKAARDLLARVTRGKDPAAERAEERAAATVSELSEAWLTRHVGSKRKPNTLASYRATMTCHVLPNLGARKATTLTRADVLRLHEGVARKAEKPVKGVRRGAAKGQGRGGEAVANKAVVLLRAMLTWAADAGLLPEGTANPATKVELFKEKPRDRPLSAGEMERLGRALTLAETTGLPWAGASTDKPPSKTARRPENRVAVFDKHAVAAVRLLALTGARLREVLHLRWSEVDLDRGVLRLGDSKTGAKTIFLSTPALAVLAGLPRVGAYVIASASAGTKDEAPRRDLKRLWAAVTRHAGLDGLVLHHLRHNVGATGAGENLSLHTIGGLLGHRQPSTTTRYAAYAADPMHRAADVIASPIARALGLPGANVVALDATRRRA